MSQAPASEALRKSNGAESSGLTIESSDSFVIKTVNNSSKHNIFDSVTETLESKENHIRDSVVDKILETVSPARPVEIKPSEVGMNILDRKEIVQGNDNSFMDLIGRYFMSLNGLK